MEKMTRHTSMKNLIPCLIKFRDIDRYKCRAKIYNGNSKFEGKYIHIDDLNTQEANDLFIKIQKKESQGLINTQERKLGHQLDILLNTPEVGASKTGNFLMQIQQHRHSRNL